MKKNLLLAAVFAVITSGCASIVSDSRYTVSINSNPNGANFTVTNRDGNSIHNGKTPASISLNSSAGYFKGETYKITLKKEGYDPKVYTLTSGVDGWYFGNILLGGLIGFLIVDPATGAMYNLPNRVDVSLDESTASASSGKVTIATIDSLTPEQIKQLVEL